MSNELQIRISADIKQLKTAMSRTEQLIKNAEGVLKSTSRSVFKLENSLVQLAKQFKAGSISEAEFNKVTELTSERLERQRANVQASRKEIDRLNSSLGSLKTRPAVSGTRSFGNNMSKLTGQVSGANTVALEFNRIIQDAPFGIIGVGNNIQQLAANFSNVSRSAGGTKAAVKASLSALITPANLALLAISAVTTAFTVYAMSSRGAKKDVDELKDAQDSLNDSFKETERLAKTGFYEDILQELGDLKREFVDSEAAIKRLTNATGSNVAERAIKALGTAWSDYRDGVEEANKETRTLLSDVLGISNLKAIGAGIKNIKTASEEAFSTDTQKNILTTAELLERLGNKVKTLTKPQLEALSTVLEREIQESTREAANSTDELVKNMASGRVDRYKGQLELVNKQLEFYKNDTNKATKATKDFTEGFDDLIEKIKLGNQTAAEAAEKVPGLAEALLKSMRDEDGIIDFKPIDVKVDYDPAQFDKLTDAQKKVIDDAIRAKEQLEEFQKEMAQFGGQLSNVFAEAFEKGIFEGENFFDSIAQGFKRLLAQLASQLAAAAFLNILAAITTGGTSVAFGAAASANPFGSIFGREHGGPVSAGQPYIVGEKRPEIFVPSVSGRIIPRVPNSPTVSASGASGLGMQKIDVNVYGEIMNDRIVLSEARGKRANGRFYGING